MTNSQDIVPAGDSEFLMLSPEMQAEFRDLYVANIGSGKMGAGDLPFIKCAAGGATHFIREVGNEQEPTKEITAIVAAWQNVRAYWNPADPNQKRPPDCSSPDCFTGYGDPGGDCATCPFSKYGSSTKGHGQACKEVRRLLLVLPDSVLPAILRVPPTSLKPTAKYFINLLDRRLPHWAVITRITLEGAQNKDGIGYALMKFTVSRTLTPDERTRFAPIQKQLAKILAPMPVTAADYGDTVSSPGAAEANPDDIPF